MKKQVIFLACATIINSALAQTSLLIDFGPNDGTNGNQTESPDVNGNFWNNISDVNADAVTLELVDIADVSTGYTLSVSQTMSKNGINHGGLLESSPTLLDEFAVNTATQDYFFTTTTGVLKLSGLDPQKRYILSMFASRNNTETRITEYTVQGTNSWTGSLQTSGVNLGGTDYNGNNSTVLVSDSIIADASGEITIDVVRQTGSFGYIGILKVDAYDSESQGTFALLNDGFENPLAEGWDISGGVLAESTDELALVGIRSLKIQGPEGSVVQKISYLSGDTYYLGGYYYISEELGSTQEAFLEMTFFDDNQSVLSTSTSAIVTSDNTLNQWSPLLAESQVPQGAVNVSAEIIWENPDNITSGIVYFDELSLGNSTDIVCTELDPFKITFMGSSVAKGVGATDDFGYASRYSALLDERSDASGNDWETANVSIGGNNTIDVLGRWSTDLLPECGRYVIYGLSLANEGIRNGGQEKFDQFEQNMEQLILQSRERGIEPVIVSNYTRADFNAVDYQFIKDINMTIQQWDVASINVLGAIDDGAGRWADGYGADLGHPNDDGHQEFMYAFVPSLFDALHEGKPQPGKDESKSIVLAAEGSMNQLYLQPEETLHSFTISFEFNTESTGTLFSIGYGENQVGVVSVNEITGTLVYDSHNGEQIFGFTKVNNGDWHRVTLTHYYARGKTFMYTNKEEEGDTDERLEPQEFFIGDIYGLVDLEVSEVSLHRSGMNQQEIDGLNDDLMLKSSLEIYSPLDGDLITSTGIVDNLAQSTNEVVFQEAIEVVPLSASTDQIQSLLVYPNPASDYIIFDLKGAGRANLSIEIIDMSGKVILEQTSFTQDARNPERYKVSLAQLDQSLDGVYVYKVRLDETEFRGSIILN